MKITRTIIQGIDDFLFNIVTANIMNNVSNSLNVNGNERAKTINKLFGDFSKEIGTKLDGRLSIDDNSATYTTDDPDINIRVTIEVVRNNK